MKVKCDERPDRKAHTANRDPSGAISTLCGMTRHELSWFPAADEPLCRRCAATHE